jgi:CHAD domain-containing protein
MATNVRDVGTPPECAKAVPGRSSEGDWCAVWRDRAYSLLRAQFRALGRRLRECAGDPEQPRGVHRLRIATRRTDAALRLFEPLLPPRRTDRLCKRVRKIRRAAGEVRDLDVLVKRLPDAAGPDTDVLPLLAELRSRRAERADRLVDRIRSSGTRRLRKQSRRVLERIRWRADQTPRDADDGLMLLRPVMDEFRSAAEADLTDAAQLHQFRKCAKRLRYAVELLSRAVPGTALQQLHGSLEALQDRLGGINDHAAATAILSEVAAGCPDAHAVAAAEAQLTAEQAAFDTERDRFVEWWRAGGAELLLRQLP